MKPLQIWLTLFLLSFHCTESEKKEEPNRLRQWNHRDEGVCSGSANVRAVMNQQDPYEDLRKIYQNCSRVFGNIEITFFTNETLKGRKLDFFDDVREVYGYVFIYKVDTERIAFKNLEFIWGNNLIDGTNALLIEGSPNLKYVSMPKLRHIDNGSVTLDKVDNLCHLSLATNLDEVLDFKSATRFRYINSSTCLKMFRKKTQPICHPECLSNRCWGPEKEDCQYFYRSHCGDCESRQCFVNKTSHATKCCHEQCVGGCNGTSAKDCMACKHFKQCSGVGLLEECKCVEHCTPRMRYDPTKRTAVADPNGYYQLDNKECVKKCPEGRLVQGELCVEHCAVGYYYNPAKGDQVCEKCEGPCPKVCEVEKELTSTILQTLTNCTAIEGHIKIQPQGFLDHKEWNKTTVTRAITVEDLDILRSVRYVSQYVFIAGTPLQSLTFLENLEIIGGRQLFNDRQSLLISSNDHLEHLGLRKLAEVKKGDIVISKNVDLCYLNISSLNKMLPPNTTHTATIAENRLLDMCKREGKVCHSSCTADDGCMGPSARDCRQCKNWKQDNECVDKCKIRGFYPDVDTKTCGRCYVECDTCKGPGPEDCKSCRSYSLMRKKGHAHLSSEEDLEEEYRVDKHDDETTISSADNTLAPSEQPSLYTEMTCVSECPSSRYYVEKGECKRCHRSCYDFGCNGSSNVPGPNGCTKCKYGLIKLSGNGTSGEVERCLYNSDKKSPNTVCQNNDLLDHFVQAKTHDNVNDFECAKCDDECVTCTSRGASRYNNHCKCRNYVAFSSFQKKPDARCVAFCPRGFYQDNSTSFDSEAPLGVCRGCNPACDKSGEGPWCYGPDDTDCVACAKDFYSYDNSTFVRCVQNCSELGLYPYKGACSEIDYETRNKIRNAILYCTGILLLLIIIIAGYCLITRQRRLAKELEQEKVLNLPNLPELIPMNMTNAEPNRERLFLIPKQALIRSTRQLGSGAFGVVYAGCWTPPKGSMKVPVAIKVVRDPSGKAQSEMLDEATKMTLLRHENLLRIVGVCLSGEDLQLVTLLRPLGNLREFLQKHKGKLSGKELLQYSYQIASGMKYLSDNRVVHRDLAARNVLVKNIKHVEITDFGLAKLIDIGSDSVQVGEGKVAIKWLALEALENQIYNTATDVWAFGITMWEILTYGESPYTNMSPPMIKQFLMDGERLVQPNNCSTELYKILYNCWLPKPESRPTFAVLKDLLYSYCRAPHIFVFDNDYSPVPNGEFDDTTQLGMIQEMLRETDVMDPQNYFDSEPNTPVCGGGGNGDLFNPMRRMDSLTSQRYAQDPTGRKELSMADDNYLVPNSHVGEVAATMYTPVVVDDSGNSCLVESLGYYNETKPGAEYINETAGSNRNSREDRLAMIEEDEAMEKESCL